MIVAALSLTHKTFRVLLCALMALWLPSVCCCPAQADVAVDSNGVTMSSAAAVSALATHTTDECESAVYRGHHYELHISHACHSDQCTCTSHLTARDQRTVDQPAPPLAPSWLTLIFQPSFRNNATNAVLPAALDRAASNGARGSAGGSLRAQHCLLTI